MATVEDLKNARAVFLNSAQGQRIRRAWDKGVEPSSSSGPTDKQMRFIYVLRKKCKTYAQIAGWTRAYDALNHIPEPGNKRNASMLIETLIDVVDENHDMNWETEEEVLGVLDAYINS